MVVVSPQRSTQSLLKKVGALILSETCFFSCLIHPSIEQLSLVGVSVYKPSQRYIHGCYDKSKECPSILKSVPMRHLELTCVRLTPSTNTYLFQELSKPCGRLKSLRYLSLISESLCSHDYTRLASALSRHVFLTRLDLTTTMASSMFLSYQDWERLEDRLFRTIGPDRFCAVAV